MGWISGGAFCAVAATMGWLAWELRKDGWGWVAAYIFVALLLAAVGVALIVD